jgi:hypothetical protein
VGQIVAAMATCHAPALILRQPGEDPAQLDAVADAMRRLGEVLDQTRPDALLIVGLDHLEAFTLDCTPTFAVVVGPEVSGGFAGRRWRKPVHQALARAIHVGALERHFDVAASANPYMGHAFVVPFEYVLGDRAIPVVPFFVNIYVPPLPSPIRCYELGRALADIIAQTDLKVAILASGGMSHFPGTERYPNPEFDFDTQTLETLKAGEASTLLSLGVERLDELGNTELLTWFTLFGAIGDQPADVYTYQPTWHHGLGVLSFPLAQPIEGPPAAAPMPTAIDRGNGGYAYYRPPEPESYNLNRLLYNLRMNPAERKRLVENLDAVAAEYQLRPDEVTALKTLEPLAVARAGGHPIAAWVAVQTVAADLRKAQAAASQA